MNAAQVRLIVAACVDEAYYLEIHPDVGVAGEVPSHHFLEHGWREGRSPNPYFDLAWYLEQYPDVAELRMNALEHYVRWGWQERRLTHPSSEVQKMVARTAVLAPEFCPLLVLLSGAALSQSDSLLG